MIIIVEDDRSSIAHVLSGIPQGSVLGSLLLLIYIDRINSISMSHESSWVVYADDVCIYRPIPSCSDFQHVQEDIEAVGKWSTENFLNLDPSKCKYMLISRKRTPTTPEGPLLLGDLPLQRINTFKYLGVNFYCPKTCHGLLMLRQFTQKQKMSLDYFIVSFTAVLTLIHSHSSMSL